MKKVSVISLGCPKNTVDSEKILGILGNTGYAISVIPEEADFVIVNTCAFIKPAVEESMQTISKLIKKKQRKKYKLIIAGCLPARDYDFLRAEKGIDGIIGPYQISQLPCILSEIDRDNVINAGLFYDKKDYCGIPRAISTWPYGYLKITDGCSNYCSYCTIPFIRGPLFSFEEKQILKEAESLFNSGVKELIIVGHDITAYGKDRGKSGLCNLIREILKIGFPWIRLMYLHPSGITKDLLELINDTPEMCRYLDIPLQHVHPDILRSMNRPVMDYMKLIESIRKAVPGIVLRTTFIVGFPGESEEIFNYLLEFVRTVRFERLGVFIYYPEKGTRASILKQQIPLAKKKERFFRLMEVQKKISKEIACSFIGKAMEVLVEKQVDGYLSGRTQMDAPDIDWTAKIHGKASPGEIVRIRITRSSSYSLSGKICGNV